MTMKPPAQTCRRDALRTCLVAGMLGALGLFGAGCSTPGGSHAHSDHMLSKAVKHPSCVTRAVPLPDEYDHGSSAAQPLRLTLINVKKPTSGTSYRAFLNKPDATTATPAADPHCLGSISFFGPAPENDFVLDAGRTLDKLRQDAAYKPAETVSVTLVPADGGEAVQVDELRLVVPN